jgi:hypothetical protein
MADENPHILTQIYNITLSEPIVQSFFGDIDPNQSATLAVIEEDALHASVLYATFDPMITEFSMQHATSPVFSHVPINTAVSFTSYLTTEILKEDAYYGRAEAIRVDQSFNNVLEKCCVEKDSDNKLIATKTLFHPDPYQEDDQFFACDLDDPQYRERLSTDILGALKSVTLDDEDSSTIYPEKFFAIQGFLYPENNPDTGLPKIAFSDMADGIVRDDLEPVFVLFMQQKDFVSDFTYLDTEEETVLLLEALENSFLTHKINKDPKLEKANATLGAFGYHYIMPDIFPFNEFVSLFPDGSSLSLN